jgi:HK97 family phage major capsid protein
MAPIAEPPVADEEALRRVNQAREAALEVADKLRGMRTKPVEERSASWDAEMQSTMLALSAADLEYTSACTLSQDTSRGPIGATIRTSAPDVRSMGDLFVGNDEVKARGRSLGKYGATDLDLAIDFRSALMSRHMPGYREQAEREVRTLLDSATTGPVSAGLFVPVTTPYLPPATIDRRRLFVEEVIPSGTTNAQVIRLIRELNPRTTELGVTAVAEGGTKAELTNTFEEFDAPVRKTAGWIPITEELMEDAPALESYINGRLMYMSDLRTELDILRGAGTGAELLGILNTPGVTGHALGEDTGDPATMLAKTIGDIEQTDGYPDVAVMNPSDFWLMLTRRASSSGVYDAMFNGAVVDQVWGLRTLRTRTMASGTALVGDFGKGAMIFNRKEASIRVADQHADYFIKNLRVILVERRLALAVFRPDWFKTAPVGS